MMALKKHLAEINWPRLAGWDYLADITWLGSPCWDHMADITRLRATGWEHLAEFCTCAHLKHCCFGTCLPQTEQETCAAAWLGTGTDKYPALWTFSTLSCTIDFQLGLRPRWDHLGWDLTWLRPLEWNHLVGISWLSPPGWDQFWVQLTSLVWDPWLRSSGWDHLAWESFGVSGGIRNTSGGTQETPRKHPGG